MLRRSFITLVYHVMFSRWGNDADNAARAKGMVVAVVKRGWRVSTLGKHVFYPIE